MTRRITIRRPDDFHVHLRRGPMLARVLRHTARCFKRAIVMPNCTPEIVSAKGVREYRDEIMDVASAQGFPDFQPLMTLYLTGETTPEMIEDAAKAGAIAIKVYPRGQTTGSQLGINDYQSQQFYDCLAAAQELNLVVQLHGEVPDHDAFCLDREKLFLSTLERLAEKFDRLRIVMEHVSSRELVEAVAKLPSSVAATVTAHHLMITLNDVIGDKMRPHLFCKPIAKRAEDREAIRRVVLDGDPKFFFGSDSAPHDKKIAKECDQCSAGIFSAPVALEVLAGFFADAGRVERLSPFVSEFGARFYGLPLNEGQITLVEEPWVVPNQFDGVVPFRYWEQLSWRTLT